MNTIIFDIETGLNQDLFDRNIKPFDKQRPTKKDFDPLSVKTAALVRNKTLREQLTELVLKAKHSAADHGILEEFAAQATKIKDKIDEARLAHEVAQVEAITKWEMDSLAYYTQKEDKAAIYPGLSSICAIGYQFPGAEPVELMVGDNVKDEKELLTKFLAVIMGIIETSRNGGVLCQFGFWSGNWNRNASFDVKHIEWACVKNGIKIPGELFEPPSSYRKGYWKDISDFMFRNGPIVPDMEQGYLSLNRAADLLDLHGKAVDVFDGDGKVQHLVIADKEDLAVEGGSFYRWLQAGEIEKCREYLRNDLALTRGVANCNPYLG